MPIRGVLIELDVSRFQPCFTSNSNTLPVGQRLAQRLLLNP